MKTCFVTGGTGVVGSAIVARLLAEPATRIQLLVRADSADALRQRMHGLHRYWGIEESPEKQARVQALRGDAAAPGFGLAQADHADLTARTTHIIHSAGAVRMNLPIDAARHTAVGSARNILSLAQHLRGKGLLEKVEFVSTVGVGGRRAGVLPEGWVGTQHAFHNTYEQSKAEAEALVRDAIDQHGLPITVHRPSMVVGDSSSGRVLHFQIFYFLCDFLSGRRTLGLYPPLGDAMVDVIPVDRVAEAIVAAGNDADTRGRIFHLCSGPERAMSAQGLKFLVRSMYAHFGQRSRADITLPAGVCLGLARAARWVVSADQRRALATLPVFLDYLSSRESFCNDGYLQWLGARRCQPLPAACTYLPSVLEHYLNQRHPLVSTRGGMPHAGPP